MHKTEIRVILFTAPIDRAVIATPRKSRNALRSEEVSKLARITERRITRVTYDPQNETENARGAERKIGVCQ